jgi:DNA modification methylase
MSDIQVIHGDALLVLPTLAEGSVDAIVTDPPYGIGYEHGEQSASGRSGYKIEWAPIAGDGAPDGGWLVEAYRIMRPGAALYLCTRWDVEPQWRSLLAEAGFKVCQRLTWHKRVGGKGDLKGTYAPTCEDVIFASKGRHILNRRPESLLDVGCVPTWEKRFHPHQKPVALPKLLIEASTRRDDLVLDPFAGSGSTLVACLKSGRKAIGIEIDPQYVEIINRRLAAASTPLLDIVEASA